jgi:hypothetical protein
MVNEHYFSSLAYNTNYDKMSWSESGSHPDADIVWRIVNDKNSPLCWEEIGYVTNEDHNEEEECHDPTGHSHRRRKRHKSTYAIGCYN